MVSGHGSEGSLCVCIALRAGPEPNYCREAIADKAPVRPYPSRASIAVGKRVYPHPLAMSGGREYQHRTESPSIRWNVSWSQPGVQDGHCLLDLRFKM